MLNPKQEQAAKIIQGPVLVFAGPGTGKTHLIGHRIQYLLNQPDIAAENILCLTFTNAAAGEMQKRLREKFSLGKDARKIKICTFHSFCEWIIQEHSPFFLELESANLIDEIERALLFQKICITQKIRHLFSPEDLAGSQQNFFHALSDVRKAGIDSSFFQEKILEFSRNQFDPEASPENFYKQKRGDFLAGDMKPNNKFSIEKKIERMKEFVILWEAYEAEKKKKKFYDYNDQLSLVLQELQKNESLRLDLQERFQWIMVDEYQDTNDIQNQILWQLSPDSQANVFVVGDSDQSIYSFQGATEKSITHFREKFPSVVEIVLEENYRSYQHVLDASFGVLQNNENRIASHSRLNAQIKSSDIKIQKGVFSSPHAETQFLVSEIQALETKGIPLHEIVVLCRTNAQIQYLAKDFLRFGVPVSATIFYDIFENPWVKYLVSAFSLFVDFSNRKKYFDELLLAPFWEFSQTDLYQILTLKAAHQTNFFDFLSEEIQKENSVLSEKISQEGVKKCKDIFSFFVQAQSNFQHLRSTVILEKIFYESGMASFLAKNHSQELSTHWDNIKKLFDWSHEQKTDSPKEVLQKIQLHEELRLKIPPYSSGKQKNAVQIMTFHKSKGLEFSAVFLPNLVEKNWEKKKKIVKITLPDLVEKDASLSATQEQEEARRLFFVGMTRAKKYLYATYCEQNISGSSQNPSVFFDEISTKFCQEISTETYEMKAKELLPILFSSGKEVALSKQSEAVLQEKIKSFEWSASSLCTFLDCPKQFLYQNLLGMKFQTNSQLSAGVSLHSALEKFLRAFLKTKKLPELSFLLESFEQSLRGQNLEKEKFESVLLNGKKDLELYLEQAHKKFLAEEFLDLEPYFDSVLVENILIKGKLDKVVFTDSSKTVGNIIDYKSGKPKSFNKEKWKEGEGRMPPEFRNWFQLVFYDILIRNSKEKWIPNSVGIEFLKPDSSGNYKQNMFQVTAEDRAFVLEKLKQANEKVHCLDFKIVPNPKDDSQLDFWNNFGR